MRSRPSVAWRPAACAALLSWLAVACGGSDRTCVFQRLADGATRMVCPNGDAVLPGMEREQPPGGIRGTVRLFGRTSHAGIEVELLGASGSTVADEDGRFALEEVPAGQHVVRFRAPAYEEVTVRDILVLPGHWTTRDVELRTGRMVAGGGEWTLMRSPRDERFLALGDGMLLLVDPHAVKVTTLAAGVLDDARFSPDGSWVIYRVREMEEPGGRLWFHDVDRGRSTMVATHVVGWSLTGDGASFVYEREVKDLQILETWHQPTGRRAAVSDEVRSWRVAPDGSTLVARVRSNDRIVLVVWDLAAAGGTALPARLDGELPSFGPDARSFLFVADAGDLMLWDGANRDVLRLSGPTQRATFSPAGDGILWIEANGLSELVHFDLETKTRFSIRLGVLPEVAFSPDGSQVAYFLGTDEDDVELFVWDRTTHASRSLGVIDLPPREGGLAWSPDGSQIFVLDAAGHLHRWRSPSLELLSSAASALPRFAPGGQAFVFHEGDRLVWAPLDGGPPVQLERPVIGYPVRWTPDSSGLLFVTRRVANANDFGNAWLFTPSTGRLDLVGTDVHLQRVDFFEDGSILALERYDRGRSNRGTLTLDGEPIATGVRDGYVFTEDGQRAAFVSDAFPLAERSVLALWERPAPGSEEPGDGPIPIDSDATAQLVGTEWIAWVTVAEDRAGLYLSHFPRDLPDGALAPKTPEEPGEEVDPESDE